MKTLILSAAIMLILLTGAYGRQFLPLEQNANISSTAIGGPWSAPSTWVGGVVPAAGDNVTIAGGATVIIDTAASANSVTVGGTGSIAGIKSIFSEGGTPAVLRFGETGAFSLTVTGDVTIGPGDSFTTGGGNANQHVLTIGGNLTNNGIFDLNTNNGMAAAMLIFTGASNNTFGGSGPVTDVSWITIEKGTTSANILELSAANFSVRGSTSDTPDSGYLFLNHGTFKISGTFTCANRTFYTTPYEIATEAGLWLSNPNYTIVAQHQATVQIFGMLRVTAGTYNVGTELNDSLIFYHRSSVTLEGGNVNVAGRFGTFNDGQANSTYTQTGGTLTVCTVGNTSLLDACFDTETPNDFRVIYTISAGNIVIQNPSPGNESAYVYRFSTGFSGSTAKVQFGNEFTSLPGSFKAAGKAPDVLVFEGQTLMSQGLRAFNLEIRPDATLDLRSGGMRIEGPNFINNGKILGAIAVSYILFLGGDQVFSGSGQVDGGLSQLGLECDSLRLESARLRARFVYINGCDVINSNNITIGNNDNVENLVRIDDRTPDPGGFDTPPTFELGSGGQKIWYAGNLPRTTGFEVNPQRQLTELLHDSTGPLTISGGDLTTNNLVLTTASLTLSGSNLKTNNITLANAIVYTGPNRLTIQGAVNRTQGYVDGTVVRPFTTPGTFIFPVGQTVYSPVPSFISAVGVSPSYLSVKAVDATLPGLYPAYSVSRHWVLEETGDITAGLAFNYHAVDINGHEPSYVLWRSTGDEPVMVPGSSADPGTNFVSVSNVTDLTGNWGISVKRVSVSGTVRTAGGQPIRNAIITIWGANVPALQAVTGNFGIYQFSGLPAGENYTVRVDAKRFRFTPATQQVTPTGDLVNVDFTANP